MPKSKIQLGNNNDYDGTVSKCLFPHSAYFTDGCSRKGQSLPKIIDQGNAISN